MSGKEVRDIATITRRNMLAPQLRRLRSDGNHRPVVNASARPVRC